MFNKLALYIGSHRATYFYSSAFVFIFLNLSSSLKLFKGYEYITIPALIFLLIWFAVVVTLIFRSDRIKTQILNREIYEQIRALDNQMREWREKKPKKEIKRVYSEQDPYGEEDWEE